MTGWVSVGSGVWYKLHTCSHAHHQTPSGALIRFGGEQEDEGYDRDDICVGGISWCSECQGKTWKLESLNPLHVEPSIEMTCHKHPKHHGHIRNGQWVAVP